MRRESNRAPTRTDTQSVPGGSPDNPPADAHRQASQLVARWAVQRYLELTQGGTNDETTLNTRRAELNGPRRT